MFLGCDYCEDEIFLCCAKFIDVFLERCILVLEEGSYKDRLLLYFITQLSVLFFVFVVGENLELFIVNVQVVSLVH